MFPSGNAQTVVTWKGNWRLQGLKPWGFTVHNYLLILKKFLFLCLYYLFKPINQYNLLENTLKGKGSQVTKSGKCGYLVSKDGSKVGLKFLGLRTFLQS